MRPIVFQTHRRLLLATILAWCSVHGLAPASVLRYEMLPSTARSLDDYNAKGGVRRSLTDGDVVRGLGFLEGGDSAYPYAVNDRGQIVGTATDVTPSSANPYWRPVVSENEEWVNIAPDHPQWALQAMDINNKGQVVGGNENGMWEGQAFLYESGRFQALGTLGGRTSVARAINEAGLIVGSSRTPRDPRGDYEPVHAMLFAEGRMYDLNDLTDALGDWTFREAVEVTEDGWILTVGHPRDGGYGDTRWLKPIETPEPVSAALWLGLAGGFALWRRRRIAVKSSGRRG